MSSFIINKVISIIGNESNKIIETIGYELGMNRMICGHIF